MLKFILLSVLGSLSILSGFASGYIFIETLRDNSNFLFLVAAIIFTTGGILLLKLSRRSGYPFERKMDVVKSQSTGEKTDFESRLEQNNKMVAEWAKTIKIRDQLRVLQIAESAKKSG